MVVGTKSEFPESERLGKGKRIFEALKSGAKTIDEIAQTTKLPANSIQGYISDHENDFVKKKKNHKTTYRLQN